MKKLIIIMMASISINSLASEMKMDCTVTKCEEIGPEINGYCGFTHWQVRAVDIANTASSVKGTITPGTELEMYDGYKIEGGFSQRGLELESKDLTLFPIYAFIENKGDILSPEIDPNYYKKVYSGYIMFRQSNFGAVFRRDFVSCSFVK